MKTDKRDLLMIYKGPFGTLTDSYKWCEYLKKQYNITFVELLGEGEMFQDGIKFVRVSNTGPRFIRGIRFIFYCLFHILCAKGIIIVFYFDGCDIFKTIFPWKKMILDIRTLCVDKDEKVRTSSDKKLVNACIKYDHITIIQEDLIEKLGVDSSKFSIVPLGADVISAKSKSYEDLKLLYVGTLEGRKITDTIEGINIFKLKYPDVNICYDIVGDGISDTKEHLIELVNRYGLHNEVHIHGRIPYDRLYPFFDECNVGVSYVPITPWYDHQPPTKTFEYIMSGLFCLATSTSENKKLITKHNGILHKDNPIEFASALEHYMSQKSRIDFVKIKESLVEYNWESIVKNKLLPAINSSKKQ